MLEITCKQRNQTVEPKEAPRFDEVKNRLYTAPIHCFEDMKPAPHDDIRQRRLFQ